MTRQITVAAGFFPVLTFARAALRRLDERRSRNRVYRRTLAELRALSDRELQDLGLSRSWLRAIAREAAEAAA